MIRRILLLLASTIPAAALAQSPQACPWLNSGTVAKALGDEVTVTVHSDSDKSGSCRFVTATVPAATIEVLVGSTDTRPCGSGGTRLNAIGNQAVLCTAHDPAGRALQTISARVRESWFVLVFAKSSPKGPLPPSPNQDADSSTIEFLADQVSGNLY